MKTNLTLLTFVCSMFWISLFAQENVFLVRDRKANAAIVISENADETEKYAA